MVKDFQEFLPAVPLEDMRRIAGEQEIIATYGRTGNRRAAHAAPEGKDRQRLLTLLDRLERSARPA